MVKGICTVSVAPLRREAAHLSEMVSQLLFGETFHILEAGTRFSHIKTDFDGYEGFIDNQQFEESDQARNSDKKKHLLTNPLTSYGLSTGNILLSAGSEVDFPTDKQIPPTSIPESALLFLNVPYLWSGRSVFGIDCSGFVQLVYKLHGHSLPRDARDQAQVGEVLSFIEESLPGDLAFFDNDEGEIVHVGMMLEGHKIIHAYGKVRIDQLDSTGIFNSELKKHTHKLRFVRTLT